jgi:hypothetical protein
LKVNGEEFTFHFTASEYNGVDFLSFIFREEDEKILDISCSYSPHVTEFQLETAMERKWGSLVVPSLMGFINDHFSYARISKSAMFAYVRNPNPSEIISSQVDESFVTTPSFVHNITVSKRKEFKVEFYNYINDDAERLYYVVILNPNVEDSFRDFIHFSTGTGTVGTLVEDSRMNILDTCYSQTLLRNSLEQRSEKEEFTEELLKVIQDHYKPFQLESKSIWVPDHSINSAISSNVDESNF